MAPRGSSGRPPPVRLDTQAAQQALERLASSAEKGTKGLAGLPTMNDAIKFTLSPLLNNIKEVQKNLEQIGTQTMGAGAASAAGSLFGGGGKGFVNDVRETLGDVGASANAGARLQGVAEQFARAGLAPDKGLLQQLHPLILGQEQAAQQASRTAADVVEDYNSTKLGDLLLDGYQQMKKMFHLGGADRAK